LGHLTPTEGSITEVCVRPDRVIEPDRATLSRTCPGRGPILCTDGRSSGLSTDFKLVFETVLTVPSLDA
jgi:hypothetical protein